MSSEKRVVVVGSGAAGMTAALGAASAGAKVTVLEAADGIGGTTAISGGMSWIPGTRWGTCDGAPDTPEKGRDYVLALGLGDIREDLLDHFVNDGEAVMDAIAENSEIEWQGVPHLPDYHSEIPNGNARRGVEMKPLKVSSEVLDMLRHDPYGTWPATLTEANANEPGDAEIERRNKEGIVAQGRGLVCALTSAVLERGGEVLAGVRVTELNTDESGAVVGVRADGKDYPGSVIIASGGFEWNEELVKTFLRGPLMGAGSPPTNRGDGLIMGMSVGAELGNMSEAWWAPCMKVPGEEFDGSQFFRITFTDVGKPAGILVNSKGKRFMNEALNYSCFGRSMQGFDGSSYSFPGAGAWFVFDAKRRAGAPLGGESGWTLNPEDGEITVRDPESEPEWLIRKDNLADLAAEIGVDADTLQQTVDRYNELAAKNSDEDFGRGDYPYDLWVSGGKPLTPIEMPPYYALRIYPGALGTKGGLRTDEFGRVRKAGANGAPISGLYAAGNASANIFGLAYPGPGATIGPAIFFGWRAGQHAAGGNA